MYFHIWITHWFKYFCAYLWESSVFFLTLHILHIFKIGIHISQSDMHKLCDLCGKKTSSGITPIRSHRKCYYKPYCFPWSASTTTPFCFFTNARKITSWLALFLGCSIDILMIRKACNNTYGGSDPSRGM